MRGEGKSGKNHFWYNSQQGKYFLYIVFMQVNKSIKKQKERDVKGDQDDSTGLDAELATASMHYIGCGSGDSNESMAGS